MEMESAFRTRVDRTFGVLLGLNQASTESEPVPSVADLPVNTTAGDFWSVSERAISTARFASTGDDDTGGESDDNAAADYRRFVRLERRGRRRRRDDLTADEREEEDSEEEGRERKRRREREFEGDGAVERTEEDDAYEVREMRRMIGRDCTLDFEEEEDEYDKVAVGREGAGERMYMKEITGSCPDICHLPPGHSGALGTFRRDARANHAAAAARLREDMEAQEMNGRSAANTGCSSSQARLPSVSSSISCLKHDLGDEGFAKEGGDQVAEKKENPSEASSATRGNFEDVNGIAGGCEGGKSFVLGGNAVTGSCNLDKDIREPSIKTEERSNLMRKEKKARTVRFAVAEDPLEEKRERGAEGPAYGIRLNGITEVPTNRSRFSGLPNYLRNPPRVPDYVRNPSKYTHYTLEWSDDEDESKKNRTAFQSFQALSQETEKPDGTGSMDLPQSITFTPKFSGNSSKANGSEGENNKKDVSFVQAQPLVSFVESIVEDDLNSKTGEDLSPRNRSSEGKTARVFRKRARATAEDDVDKETETSSC